MKHALLFMIAIFTVVALLLELAAYNSFSWFSPDPKPGDTYLCDNYSYVNDATHVVRVIGVSEIGNMVRTISISLVKSGGDVIEGVRLLDNVETEIRTMDNMSSKLKTQLDKLARDEAEWDTLYLLYQAMKGTMGENMYKAYALPIGKFKRNCVQLTNRDIITYWKSN